MGHLECQFAKAKGLVTMAIEVGEEGLQLAKDCGADVFIDARYGMNQVVKRVLQVEHFDRGVKLRGKSVP